MRATADLLGDADGFVQHTQVLGELQRRSPELWPQEREDELMDTLERLIGRGLLERVSPKPFRGDNRLMAVDLRKVTDEGWRWLEQAPAPRWRRGLRWGWGQTLAGAGILIAAILAGPGRDLVVSLARAGLRHWFPGVHLP